LLTLQATLELTTFSRGHNTEAVLQNPKVQPFLYSLSNSLQANLDLTTFCSQEAVAAQRQLSSAS
jgi:hypothetical protein